MFLNTKSTSLTRERFPNITANKYIHSRIQGALLSFASHVNITFISFLKHLFSSLSRGWLESNRNVIGWRVDGSSARLIKTDRQLYRLIFTSVRYLESLFYWTTMSLGCGRDLVPAGNPHRQQQNMQTVYISHSLLHLLI